MNDPWDVKSVRQSDQYISCMKLSGIPLLPPVLSKECRKEMKYYKILAKEVQKRMSVLRPLVESESDSAEDYTDAPELPEYEHTYEAAGDKNGAIVAANVNKFSPASAPAFQTRKFKDGSDHSVMDEYNNITSSVFVKTSEKSGADNSLIIDLSLSINDSGKTIRRNLPRKIQRSATPPLELPERDYNSYKKDRRAVKDVDSSRKNITRKDLRRDSNDDSDVISFDYSGRVITSDGPPSISAKSFTGSLVDIHKEIVKESDTDSKKLIRQSSYTLLQPSPQLQAHLEMESINTGIDLACISMSESLSNIHSPYRKRRSWDLETAKMKWSTMALELKEANVLNNIKPKPKSTSNVFNVSVKSTRKQSPVREICTGTDTKQRQKSSNIKTMVKPELANKRSVLHRNTPSNKMIAKDDVPAKTSPGKKKPTSPNRSLSSIPTAEIEDSDNRVRDLYEKIKQQQLVQMANLIEKQKREQLLLKQVFEEQNNMLFKQLKMICPESGVEAKPAWGDNGASAEPVSLSQLMELKTPIAHTNEFTNTVSPTLVDTKKCLKQCDDALKKSRHITATVKRRSLANVQQKSNNASGVKGTAHSVPSGSVTRTHSPNRSISRKLVYDSGATDHDLEPILTDRTNDTLTDLNGISFPFDNEDVQLQYNSPVNDIQKDALFSNITSPRHPTHLQKHSRTAPTDMAIKSLENSIQSTMSAMCNSSNKKIGAFHTVKEEWIKCNKCQNTFSSPPPLSKRGLKSATTRRKIFMYTCRRILEI